MIACWPGKIPAGRVCDEFCTTMDFLPTFARLAGAELPSHKIDGFDIRPLLLGEAGAHSPYESFYYYWANGLDAVRSGPWKLHFPHPYRSLTGEPGQDGNPAGYTQQTVKALELYNLDDDIGEKQNVAAEHPEIVAKLKRIADAARKDLGDEHTKQTGTGRRPVGRLP